MNALLMAIAGPVAVIIGGISIIVLISFLLSLPVMLLWDAVIPDIFGLGTITWLQAWGLSLLCGLLFKSHGSKKD